MTLVKRLGVAMAILAALVAAVEIAAGATRASHNRSVRDLGDGRPKSPDISPGVWTAASDACHLEV